MTRGITRRDVLRAGAVAGALGTLPGCDAVWSRLGPYVDGLPERLDVTSYGDGVDPHFHLLSRATWGPRPGEVDALRAEGADAWLERQLEPETIDDGWLELRLEECELIRDDAPDLESVLERDVRAQLERAALLRAVHSRRQLHEVVVAFWTDHFSIDVGKRGCLRTKPHDDAAVVRAHALGRFRDLVRASALSPAMLVYLDGKDNRKASAGEQPNENYARELLELHTLGVHGGYTQTDVMEAARCLTGWTLDRDSLQHVLRGEFARAGKPVFRREQHDDGPKVVLGRRIPAGGGERDLEELVDVVCAHPATARFVSEKLCRRFVADAPPAALVHSTAEVFRTTDGDVRALLRHVLRSDEFRASAGAKLKRPFRFVASALRALGVEARAKRPEMGALERMGHVPFAHPTPDGYPDEAEPWTGTLLWRWNFALSLATGALGASRPDLPALARRAGLDARTDSPAELAPLFFGRRASDAERASIDAYLADTATSGGGAADARAEAVALLLASPGFQVH